MPRPPITVAPQIFSIRTDKDVHFTGAILQNAKEDENLTGLVTNKIRISGISLQADEQLDYRVIFWSKDIFDDTDLDLDAYLGEAELDLTNFGFRIGGANQYYLDLRGIDIDYEDKDATRELHISLMNLSAAAKTAGGNGEVIAEIYYEVRA